MRLQSPLQLLEAIVDRTAGELAERATTSETTSENFTPFAVKTFDTEMVKSATYVFFDMYVVLEIYWRYTTEVHYSEILTHVVLGVGD